MLCYVISAKNVLPFKTGKKVEAYTKTFMFFLLLGWSLTESNQKCSGGTEYDYGYLPTVDHCATKCFGISSWFNFAKRKFGNDLCGEDCDQEGCRCICTTGTGSDFLCGIKDHKGYDVYRLLDAHTGKSERGENIMSSQFSRIDYSSIQSIFTD